MLQQTQAARVAERFDALIADFPTPAALAQADIDDLLTHWQGLGYYRRARHLHAAAGMIVEQCDGTVPLDVDELLQLPGVGRYTAGSIASIAGGRRVPIVDGNVRRVLARLHGDPGRSGDSDLEDRTWQRAQELVQACGDPAVLNEGLMELGATVCTPKSPTCGQCPLRDSCRARADGTQAAIPAPKARRDRPVEHLQALLVHRRGRVLLTKGTSDDRWAGLWQPLMLEAPAVTAGSAFDSKLTASVLSTIGHVSHTLTHRQIEVDVHGTEAPAGVRLAGADHVWTDPADPAVPVSSLGRKILGVFIEALDRNVAFA